ncbi:FtsX-like permease family protein [Iodidimonas sp. SYSU 1G8]|uniref:ABC transporter permease n=1 Tax=Iodidimonas sp. SYSU 1G8 TaxID=3133967 RepID=UPI0031FED849
MPLSLRLALRELRGGLKGFTVFLLCIVLGVAAIAAVGGVREAVMQGISEHGRPILGGDIELRMTSEPLPAPALDYITARYPVSRTLTLRSMAAADLDRRATVELKAVDGAYPLYGAVELVPAMPLAEALAERNGRWGAIAEQAVLDKTRTTVGDTLRIGDLDYEIRAVTLTEPDKAGDGFTLGARVIVSDASVGAAALIQQGSIVRHQYRLKLPPDTDLEQVKQDLDTRFPDAGWRMRDRQNGADGVKRFLERLAVFLSLSGLTALLVGGVGVANATSGYMATKREAIATFKCLGAGGGTIFRIYLWQVLLIALVGVAIGLVIGAAIPFAAIALLQDMLPVPARAGLYPGPLLLASAYGVLTVLAFAVWPLGRARDVPAAGLFRQIVAPVSGRPHWRYMAMTGAAVLALAGLAVLFSDERRFTLWFLLGAAASFVVLWLAGLALMRFTALLPRPSSRVWRMALGNLHRPGAATPNVVLSLGLGLTLLVTVAQITTNLGAQIEDGVPADAPAYYFIDIQPDQIEGFETMLRAMPGVSDVTRAPMLRATITEVDGVRAEDAKIAGDAQWAVRGDRGLTYAAELPKDNRVVAGEWWPKDYAGPPLISFDAQLAEGMNLSIGDTLTFNIMGRPITAAIGNLRDIDWSGMGMNFSVIFAPGTLEAAPHSHLATVKVDAAHEAAIDRAVAEAYPNVTAVRVRDILNTVGSLLEQINQAVSAAASAALVAGVVVLAGAMAAGYADRVRDAVVLKVLGARRSDIARVYLVEYALMGLITALIAMALGTLGAWLVITRIMDARWIWQPEILVATAIGGLIVTVAFGFLGTWRALGEKPAPLLRTE